MCCRRGLLLDRLKLPERILSQDGGRGWVSAGRHGWQALDPAWVTLPGDGRLPTRLAATSTQTFRSARRAGTAGRREPRLRGGWRTPSPVWRWIRQGSPAPRSEARPSKSGCYRFGASGARREASGFRSGVAPRPARRGGPARRRRGAQGEPQSGVGFASMGLSLALECRVGDASDLSRQPSPTCRRSS